MKIRGLPFNLNLIKALGGSPIIVAPPELYSALEKGVVDGYGWPQIGHIERKFHEIVKYQIDHPYYKVCRSPPDEPGHMEKAASPPSKTCDGHYAEG